MNIILTSTGLELDEVINKIKNILEIPFENIKMLVIPQARKYEYNKEKYINDYVRIGFKESNIIMFDDEKPDKYKNLDIDLIYVCGGNTFLLQDCILKSKFDSEIKKYINNRCYIFRSECWQPYRYFRY